MDRRKRRPERPERRRDIMFKFMVQHAITKQSGVGRVASHAIATAPSRMGRRRAERIANQERFLALDAIVAPYGKLVQTISLNEYTYSFTHPFAMLYLAANACPESRRLFSEHLKQKRTEIIIHADETVLGNPLRHDKGRSVLCMRWTMSAFPDWFIVRTAAWLPLCVLPAKDVDGGNVSAVLADMAKLFCGDGTFNFDSTGMTLVDHNDQEYHFTAALAESLQTKSNTKNLHVCEALQEISHA